MEWQVMNAICRKHPRGCVKFLESKERGEWLTAQWGTLFWVGNAHPVEGECSLSNSAPGKRMNTALIMGTQPQVGRGGGERARGLLRI